MRKILLISAALLAFWSCNSSSDNASTEEEAVSIVGDDYRGLPMGNIELNDGQKWQVNEEMKPFVNHGRRIVQEFIRKKHNNYKDLAAQLEQENSQLIKSCTMEGKSHEELHRWLHPHLELVKELSGVEDEAQGENIVRRLDASYKLYSEYFQ